MKKKTVKLFVILAIIAVMILAGVIFLSFYTDYLQLVEIGANFTKVFWTDFSVKIITYLISFGTFLILLLINFFVIRANLTSIDSSFRYLKKVTPIITISLVLAGILAFFSMERISDKFLPFLTSEWFNLGDPIFHQDVGYYVFQRPFYSEIFNTLLMFSGFIILLTVLTYLVLYGRFDFYNLKQLLREKGVVNHVITSVIVYFFIKAISYKFIVESILYSENNEFTGAGYVDLNVWYTYYRIAPIILILVVIATIVFVLNSKIEWAVVTVAVYPVTFLIATVIAGIMQTIVVSPNEMAVELPYIENNIQFTRAAYNLNNATEKDFDVQYDLDGDKVMNNLETVNNIRLVDHNQTLKMANQIQSIRNYYQFKDADIVMYEIDGKKTAVFTSAREMDKSKLDESGKNYINTKMKYTHGMGLVMNPVNEITEEGQPRFIIRDIPPRSTEGVPDITQPRIYFGEEKEDYVIVNTKDKEVDEIEPEGFSYDGPAGIPLNFLNRALYAVELGDFRLLISDQITSESKLLLNKNIITRVKKVAPFLKIDHDAKIVVDDEGRLKWIIDGYTTSQSFPYAQYQDGYNYIRNSVKIVVDAYDGSVKFYIIDQNDPIIRSYNRIYPTLFEQEPLPADLASHISYPEYLFGIQSNILKKYHITNASDFYKKLGMWATSKEKYSGDKSREVEPYYSLIKMDDGVTRLVLMQPYTLVNKDNMVAWLAVSCEYANYGQMTAYKFNDNNNIYGTYQIENRVDADPEISRDLALWDQGTSNVIRGNMMVVPIENNILYVEPIYIAGDEEGALPEIKRIIVAYDDKVVSKPTFDEAINALFGVNRPAVSFAEETIDSVIARVLQNYENVKSFSKETDWENYGKAMSELDSSIQDLKNITDIEKIESEIPQEQVAGE